MVILKKEKFPELENKYNEYFNLFPYTLSSFQKWSIQAIIEKNHSLITAHTGSGKTVPAEFAIQYFHKMGKKVIYTSPIKALSNQKYYDLRTKFPHINFGILTGDCKDNPDADVLIMTTEILRNTLFNKKIMNSGESEERIPLHFDMDIDNELAAVVFDEVHYIADEGRGSVWEQAILLLPIQVQLIMLSATIYKPENFASWVEIEKQKQGSDKLVILSSTTERVVPLTHYGWISAPKSIYKKCKGTPDESKIRNILDKMITLKTAKGEIKEKNYHLIHEVKSYISKNNIFIKRSYVLNQMIKYLNNENMLPAMCFIFSRKQVEECASEITVSLFDKDSDIPARISQECKKLLINKIPNYQEYVNLPEYQKTISLLEKGIAIHHAGVIPILREMTEMLFDKGYIKVLFATETFAVGINMPTKTVIFSKLTKWNGHKMRQLFPNEYTQMAGRAGRRGIDKVGHVIHCNNLFEMSEYEEYRNILIGAPKAIKSQFKISYNIILNIISTCQSNNMENVREKIMDFMKKSMIQTEIDQEIKGCNYEIKQIEGKLEEKKKEEGNLSTPKKELDNYSYLLRKLKDLNRNQQKKIKKQIGKIEQENPSIKKDINYLYEMEELEQELITMNRYLDNSTYYLKYNMDNVLDILHNNHFINFEDEEIILTKKGIISTHFQELHCLAMADLYEKTNGFENFSSKQMIGLFSCFTNIGVKEENKSNFPRSFDKFLEQNVRDINQDYEKYYTIETDLNIDTGVDYKIHFEILDEIMEWCDCETEEQCKVILNDIKMNKSIFLGEFVKAILKINNIAVELENICEIMNNISLLKKIQEIPSLTMKYIANNQSLYI
jgi:superfamily II RNA helicase